MKGVVFRGDRELELMDFPDPTPGPDEVVLEIKASGMCGSDLKYYRAPPGGGAPSSASARARPGRSSAGTSPAAWWRRSGQNVSPKQARVGQRAMQHHYAAAASARNAPPAGCSSATTAWTEVYGATGHGAHAQAT